MTHLLSDTSLLPCPPLLSSPLPSPPAVVFEELVKEYIPDLYEHISKLNLLPMIALSWFLTIFTRSAIVACSSADMIPLPRSQAPPWACLCLRLVLTVTVFASLLSNHLLIYVVPPLIRSLPLPSHPSP